jgi:hypothetical protein
MTPAGSAKDATIFLKKATWYLESAITNADAGRFNPAVSDAVISAINASDVVCIAATGSYAMTSEHSGALRHLQGAGDLGQRAAGVLGALLPKRNESQYRSRLNSRREADAAIAGAELLLDLAREAIASQRR